MDTILLVCVLLFVIRPRWVVSLILDCATEWKRIFTKAKKEFKAEKKDEGGKVSRKALLIVIVFLVIGYLFWASIFTHCELCDLPGAAQVFVDSEIHLFCKDHAIEALSR